MGFPGIRLVEQTEQKFRRFESVLKTKAIDCNSRALFLMKVPTKKLAKRKRNSNYCWTTRFCIGTLG